MRLTLRSITVALVLGVVTTAASVPLIAYWPRDVNPIRIQLDRDRRPDEGEGRGFISLRYDTGFGYRLASGTASQQFILGGYNYLSTTDRMPWPESIARRAAPWTFGTEKWPPDGTSRQVQVLSIGWPLSIVDGEWSQTLSRPRPGPPPLAGDSEPTNTLTTTHWEPTNQPWSPYGGWAYMNSPLWLKTSRFGQMIFNKWALPAIPTRPIWIGATVNTLLFASVWFATVTLTARARRALKKARAAGRCEFCHYPRTGLAADAPCPECGKCPGRDSNPRPAV